MRLALEEGRKALPACLPNPPVGCVLVRDGIVIARGFTQQPYGNHAEAMALAQVSGSLADVIRYAPGVHITGAGREGAVASMFSRGGESVEIQLLAKHPLA